MKFACAVVCLGVLAAPSWGQLIGRVPPAPPPTPEFVPPPPPEPVAPPKPVEPEKPPPSLVVQDNGKVRRYVNGPERAAIELFPFDDATRTKIAASDAKRNAELERLALDRLDAVLAARVRLRTIAQVKTINEFDAAKQAATPLQVEKLSDRLLRDGAITPSQQSKLEQMVKEYEAAIGQEIRSDPKFDVQNIFNAVAATSFEKATRDMLGAFEHLASRAAAKLPDSVSDLNLTSEQSAALGRAPSVDALVSTLSVDQIRALLGKSLPDAPAK